MPRKSRKNVGLIGLGIIGSRVAAGLRASGYHVFVWNRNPRPVPNFLGSPIEVVEMCEVIQLFVADGQAVFQTIEAFADALTEKHVVINCATIGPEATLEAARMVQSRGAAFLDAPFTGSKGAAEKSQLVYYVGGESSVFERVKPVLEATSRAIVHCGKIGDAAVLKVATNMITAVTTQTLAEALAIVRKRGIAPEAFGAALQQNACKSGVIDLKLPKMLTGDFSPHFSVKHMFKDVQLAIQLANSMDLEIPATAAAAGVLFGGMNKGWGDMDFASVFKQFSDNDPAEPVKSLSSASEAKAAQAAALVEELERAEFIEAQIIPGAKPVEPPKPSAPPEPKADEPKVIEEPIGKKETTTAPEPRKESVQSPPPATVASGASPARDVEELARAIADLGKGPAQGSGTTGEPAKISRAIQGATLIEAEVVDAEPKPAQSEPGKEETKAETKPGEDEQGFRPFQRLRRFFSPAGK
jgi:3-hydroxyisobutyrate dehydrogenase-like beta-hydroxyacid dehydrogenase